MRKGKNSFANHHVDAVENISKNIDIFISIFSLRRLGGVSSYSDYIAMCKKAEIEPSDENTFKAFFSN